MPRRTRPAPATGHPGAPSSAQPVPPARAPEPPSAGSSGSAWDVGLQTPRGGPAPAAGTFGRGEVSTFAAGAGDGSAHTGDGLPSNTAAGAPLLPRRARGQHLHPALADPPPGAEPARREQPFTEPPDDPATVQAAWSTYRPADTADSRDSHGGAPESPDPAKQNGPA
jgi:hypothetical protein